MNWTYNATEDRMDAVDDFDPAYRRHYITTNARGLITDGWSDGPHPERDTAGAICINARGEYQFRLYPGGEENPPLADLFGIPLYRWTGETVEARTEVELEADRALLPVPKPAKSPEERLDALEAAIERGLSL